LPSIEEQLEGNGPIRKLTLCVASWIRFLDGKDEDGDEIPVQDPQADRITQVVRASNRKVRPVLEMHDIFGHLGSNERFVTELQYLLDMLYELGARGTLEFAKL
jgi:mannitol 2-dehydrogenase